MKIPFWKRTIIPELWEECLSWAQQIGFLAKWIDTVDKKADDLDERVTELEEGGASSEDVSDSKVTFVELNDYNIQSGSTLKVLFGKIKHLISSLKAVAFSGSYNDLSDKPSIPVIPELATVATTGDYNDLINKPTIPDVSGKQNIVLGSVMTIGGQEVSQVEPALNALNDYKADKSSLSRVAETGNYNDLNGKPILSDVAYTGNYYNLINRPQLAPVATSGDYNDLSNKPDIPEIPPFEGDAAECNFLTHFYGYEWNPNPGNELYPRVDSLKKGYGNYQYNTCAKIQRFRVYGEDSSYTYFSDLDINYDDGFATFKLNNADDYPTPVDMYLRVDVGEGNVFTIINTDDPTDTNLRISNQEWANFLRFQYEELPANATINLKLTWSNLYSFGLDFRYEIEEVKPIYAGPTGGEIDGNYVYPRLEINRKRGSLPSGNYEQYLTTITRGMRTTEIQTGDVYIKSYNIDYDNDTLFIELSNPTPYPISINWLVNIHDDYNNQPSCSDSDVSLSTEWEDYLRIEINNITENSTKSFTITFPNGIGGMGIEWLYNITEYPIQQLH